MTWNAKVTRTDGTNPTAEGASEPDYLACNSCEHGQLSVNLPSGMKTSPCGIPKVFSIVGYLLTSVDVGIDGHLAPGEAVLKCAGYEPKE